MIIKLYIMILTIYGGLKLMEGVFKNESDKQELCKDTEQKTGRMG